MRLVMLLGVGAFGGVPVEELVASLRRRVEQPVSASVLHYDASNATRWAVLLAGEARSFVQISERVERHLIRPLDAVGGADAYFVLDAGAARETSEVRWAAAFDGFRVLGLRQSSNGLVEKRSLAVALFEAVEHAVRRNYDFVLSSRPDVDQAGQPCQWAPCPTGSLVGSVNPGRT